LIDGYQNQVVEIPCTEGGARGTIAYQLQQWPPGERPSAGRAASATPPSRNGMAYHNEERE